MENICTVCGKNLEDEGNVCETCFEVLKRKYPNKKDFEKILKWHKKQNKKLNQ